MDAKDILGLPRTPLTVVPERRHRPQKDSQRKPDGVSREVYALTGGLAPLVPSLDASYLKRRPQSDKEKVAWQWLPFTSSARTDNLQLYHWVRVVNGVPPTGDYFFAKYNKSVEILKYTDEEYEKHLTDPMWSKDETDQLFDLCERFDLRFIIIADRFPSSRSVEELKSRYYGVTRALLLVRATNDDDISDHPIMKEPYNFDQEVERKCLLSSVLSQTRQQEKKDVEILAEAKRIVGSRMALKATEENDTMATSSVAYDADEKLATPVESVSPSSNVPLSVSDVTATSLADAVAFPPAFRMHRVYLRTAALDHMIQATNSSIGLRTMKRIEQTLQELMVGLKPKVPTKAVCIEHVELRKEIITLLSLQKQLQHKDAEASTRDAGYDETPSISKRLQREQDRLFAPEAITFGGERIGKRDSKRKAHGRYSDGPQSPLPSTKRPRKLKASDS